jgi:hypothetical protein
MQLAARAEASESWKVMAACKGGQWGALPGVFWGPTWIPCCLQVYRDNHESAFGSTIPYQPSAAFTAVSYKSRLLGR